MTAAGYVLATVAILAASAAASAAEQRRELGVHQHGRSTLDIAVEDGRMAMELRAPAADLVGFERHPATEAEEAAVQAARDALSDPIALFGLPADAACRVVSVDAELEVEDGHHGDAHGEDGRHGDGHHHNEGHHDEGHHDDGHLDAAQPSHAEFHVAYVLECDAVERLERMAIRWFETFAAAEALVVSVIGARKQSRRTVERGAVTLDLSNHF